jgi:hypothetical protein
MTLALNGTKRWPDLAALKSLGLVCDVAPSRQRYWRTRLEHALTTTAEAVVAFARTNRKNEFGRTRGARMLELWAHGLAAVRPGAGQALHDDAADLRRESAAG